jgi:hypothetical protein
MAGGELIVSIFPEQIVLESYKRTGNKKTLMKKQFEKFNVPLSDFNKVDAMDVERIISLFLGKDKFRGGKVNLVVFGNTNVMPYHEFELDTTNKKEIKTMLPLEIENLGDHYLDFEYRYDILGSKVKVYFLKKNIVEHLGSMKFTGAWELGAIVPGYISYQGILPGDGVILDIGKDSYTLYGFRNGYISDIETGVVYKDFSVNRPLDPTPDHLVSLVEEDVKQYITNFNFNHSTELDLVTVVVNGNVKDKFTSKDVDGVFFEVARDLRNWFEVSEVTDVFSEDKKDVSCLRFDYSSVALGFYYLDNNISKYDFSPEKLGIFYKNLTVLSVSFSLVLVAALASVSVLTDNQIIASDSEVKAYELNISKYEEMVKGLDDQIVLNDEKINDYNDYVSSLENLSNMDRNFISEVMEYLPENTPSTILIQDLKLTKGTKKLVINGLSESYKDIGSLAIELEKFGTVKINKIENNKLMNVTGYPFEIELSSF